MDAQPHRILIALLALLTVLICDAANGFAQTKPDVSAVKPGQAYTITKSAMGAVTQTEVRVVKAVSAKDITIQTELHITAAPPMMIPAMTLPLLVPINPAAKAVGKATLVVSGIQFPCTIYEYEIPGMAGTKTTTWISARWPFTIRLQVEGPAGLKEELTEITLR